MRTYSSYKETSLSSSNDVSPPHIVYLGQSTLTEASKYFDTKDNADFPAMYMGYYLPVQVAANNSHVRKFSIDVEAQVKYRGVRYDNTEV